MKDRFHEEIRSLKVLDFRNDCYNLTKVHEISPIFKEIFSLIIKGGSCMQSKDMIVESTQRAIVNFQNIKDCIQGLYEILRISQSDNNIFFKIGMDNIEALYQNLLELVVNESGAVEFIKKVKRSEIDLDISLDIPR